MIDLNIISGFDWDMGNLSKNWEKHKVTYSESEEVFFNTPLLLNPDIKHSQSETRYYALGQTNKSRKLFVAFTIRENRIRVVSARDMSRKDRGVYDKATS